MVIGILTIMIKIRFSKSEFLVTYIMVLLP